MKNVPIAGSTVKAAAAGNNRPYERAICPSCNGPFFRSDDRELCGICLLAVTRRAKRKIKNIEPSDDERDWYRERKPWPAGMHFDDANVPPEPCAGRVGLGRRQFESFGASQISKADFWRR